MSRGSTERAGAEDLGDEALAWLMRLHAGAAGHELAEGFRRWRALSNAHEAAAREAEEIWGLTSLLHRDRRTGRVEPGREVARVTRRDVLRGLAGVSVLGGGAATGMRLTRGLRGDLVTGVAERQRRPLAGTGEVILNAWTSLDTDSGPEGAALTLHEGQASLSLGGEGARALVRAGRLRIRGRGPGTFDVSRNLPRDEVAVAALGAAVSVQDAGGARRLVPPGARMVFDAHGLPLAQQAGGAAAALAWQQAELIAEALPLEQVIAGLRPWSRGWIGLADAGLAGMQVNAVLDLQDPGGSLAALALGLPIRLRRVGDLLTLVVAA